MSLKSGWCVTALPDDVPAKEREKAEEQHGTCKRVFKVDGYAEFICPCVCHPENSENV